MFLNLKALFAFTLSIAHASLASPLNPYFSTAKLHPNCLKVEPTQELSTEWGMHLFAGVNFYLPFGSRQAVTELSKLISGPSDTNTEGFTKKMCGMVRIKGFKFQMEGYGDHFLVQDCSVIKKGVNHCLVNEHSEDPEQQKQGDGIVTIVWTDNASTIAIVRCLNSGLFNDWYVLSTATTLNKTVTHEILSAVGKLGFPATMDDTISPSYEGCKLFDPEDED